jgi:type II secretory pathway component GspD/PulD (secretin)
MKLNLWNLLLVLATSLSAQLSYADATVGRAGDPSIHLPVSSPAKPRAKNLLLEAVVFEVTSDHTNTTGMISFGDTHWKNSTAITSARDGTRVFTPVDETDGQFELLLTNLSSQKQVRILQRPRIQTADGITARLFVGDSIYSSATGGTRLPSRANEPRHRMNEDLGTTIDVSPTVLANDRITLKISQTVKKYAGTTNLLNVGRVVLTKTSNLQAEVTLADRQTMLIGGPIEQTLNKTPKGVPVLRSTPFIGDIFRNHPRTENVQTLLALRVTLLPDKERASAAP